MHKRMYTGGPSREQLSPLPRRESYRADGRAAGSCPRGRELDQSAYGGSSLGQEAADTSSANRALEGVRDHWEGRDPCQHPLPLFLPVLHLAVFPSHGLGPVSQTDDAIAVVLEYGFLTWVKKHVGPDHCLGLEVEVGIAGCGATSLIPPQPPNAKSTLSPPVVTSTDIPRHLFPWSPSGDHPALEPKKRCACMLSCFSRV